MGWAVSVSGSFAGKTDIGNQGGEIKGGDSGAENGDRETPS